MRHPTIEEGVHVKLGVVFPQTEIGPDPAVVRDYAPAAESAGYDHLLVFDHVLGGTVPRQEAEPRPAMTENGRHVAYAPPLCRLRSYANEVWRATFFLTGREHSMTQATGPPWSPWRAVQGAA